MRRIYASGPVQQVPCRCVCHEQRGVMHFMPCCDGYGTETGEPGLVECMRPLAETDEPVDPNNLGYLASE